jgi:hypothetical protein
MERDTPEPSVVDNRLDAAKVIHVTEEALRRIDIYDTWEKATMRIQRTMNMLGLVSEVRTLSLGPMND